VIESTDLKGRIGQNRMSWMVESAVAADLSAFAGSFGATASESDEGGAGAVHDDFLDFGMLDLTSVLASGWAKVAHFPVFLFLTWTVFVPPPVRR
jgi:hypothetical protein